jgi:hypothetical protein
VNTSRDRRTVVASLQWPVLLKPALARGWPARLPRIEWNMSDGAPVYESGSCRFESCRPCIQKP